MWLESDVAPGARVPLGYHLSVRSGTLVTAPGQQEEAPGIAPGGGGLGAGRQANGGAVGGPGAIHETGRQHVLRKDVDPGGVTSTVQPGDDCPSRAVGDDGRALARLHERPAEAWTLEGLGEEPGLSRLVLHERFVHFIGQPTMQYLTQWRMQLAAARLRDTNATHIEIALDVGYESEAAFSRAFRRVAGVAPGAWRRARRKSAKDRVADGR